MQEELQRNYDNVTAYVKNGIANQADLDAVKSGTIEQHTATSYSGSHISCLQRDVEDHD